MFYVKQSESTAARRRVPILMVDATDGATPETGLTLYGLVAKNGSTFAASAGTFAETGYGQYYYQFTTGEIDTLGFAGIHVTATGARNYDAIIHVTAYDAYSGSFIAPTDVWNADISAITSAGTAGSQLNLAALPSGAGITAGDVWEYDISGVTGAGLAGSQVNLAASGVGISAADVWNYSGFTDPGTTKETLENINATVGNLPSADTVRDSVWNAQLDYSAGFYTSPPYASGLMYQAGNGATLIPEQVWNYDISAVSGAGLAGTQLNIAAVPSGAGITSGDVWSYADRTITGGAVTTVVDPVSVSTTSMAGVANTVWSTLTAPYTTHATFGHQILRSDNAATIGEVTLHQSGGSKRVDADVHAFVNNTASATAMLNILTGIGASMTTNITGNLSGSVGSVTADVNVSTASMTGIASTVWNTDISAISTAGSAGTQLNLAALPSGAGITSGDVWTYVDRTITGGIADTVTSVTNTVDISTQSVTDIWSEDVSAYSTPSAGFDLTQAASGGVGITAGDVWDYATRTLTSGGGITAGDVWEYDISAISTAGSAGTQLNLAASPSGAGITAGDVWNYVYLGSIEANSAAERLEDTRTFADTAQNNTNSIGEQVWTYNPAGGGAIPAAGGYLIQAGDATTTAAESVWTYDISAISTAGTAGSQLNLAALPSGVGISAYDVWNFDPTAMTSPQAGAILTDIQTDTNSIITDIGNIPNNVWASDVSGYVNPGEAGYELYQAGSAIGITVGDVSVAVWDADPANYSNNSTFGKGILRSDNGGIAGTVTVWSGAAYNGVYADAYRIDASYDAATALKDILTGVGSTITGNITGDVSGSVGSVTSDVNVSTTSMSGIANTVWSTDVSGYTNPSAGYDLSQAASGSGITAGDVWSYSDRTITGGSVTSVVDGVTVTTNNDKTGYELSGTQSFNLTGNITGDLSGSVGSVTADVNVSTSSMTGIASTVWDYVTRTLTSGAGITAGDIWEYDISAITTAGTAGSQVNLAASPSGAGITAGDVWNYSGFTEPATVKETLESANTNAANASGQTGASQIRDAVWDTDLSYLSGTTQAAGILYEAAAGTTQNAPTEVWSYATRTLTSGSGITAGDVWDYSTRTITGGSVTSVVNGVTVTTNNDKTGYSLSGTQSFNLTGNITGSVSGSVGSVTGSVGSVVSPVTVSTASMSGIANTVWTAPAKTITGGTVDTVTNPVSVASASMTGIAGTVWTYATRTLTSGAGATAGDIWTYNISGITASGTAGATLNDASVSGSVVTIVNGPYRLTSIAEGTDGRIDILAESVQTIQLNCLDGFGQPFNVTGYAVVVNVYDVSGALTVTYTPTVDFASSGIVSFDIDTDVTGTTGRYTLVVELTAGAEVVQLGPIEILVRPL